jgi:glycosyltransferase involved in cell wall biosynthesis
LEITWRPIGQWLTANIAIVLRLWCENATNPRSNLVRLQGRRDNAFQSNMTAPKIVRILTVSHFYENHGGGIERVAAQLCRQFARDGHRALWAASDCDPLPEAPIRAIPLGCSNPTEAWIGLPMPIPGPRAIRNLARAIGASDSVIVHDSLYLTSIFAMLIARARRKPVVLVQHIAEIRFANAFMRDLMRIANYIVTKPMLHAAQQLVFISEEVRRELLGADPFRQSMLLFNGVDNSIFHPRDPRNRDTIRLRHGLPADAKLALFVGRFVEKKGLNVVEAIARNRPDLQIAMVGSGPMRPEAWNLPNIHLLGPQSQQTIAELYGAADLFLLPSVGEGYPLVIQEAMTCGLPVVCGDLSARADPGAERWLRGVEIDLVDPAGSAERCIAAIDSLSRDSIDRTAMAEYAAETYSWPAMARAIVQSLSRPVEAVDCAAGRFQPG